MKTKPVRHLRVPSWFLTQIIAVSALAAASLTVLVGSQTLGSGFSSALSLHFGLDRLSAAFLLLVCSLGMATALGGLGSGGRSQSRLGGWLGLGFILAMALFLTARDALGFLVGWELMSLMPAAAILLESRAATARKAVLIYIGTTHLAGVGVWIALLHLASTGQLSGAASATAPPVIIALAVVGFAAKAGLVPLQFWLPRAHPLAPAPISALMSGVMIALPFYALIRLFFEWSGSVSAEFGYALVLAGVASAVYGAYCAVMAGEMKRLLAFSSIENVGLAAIALGLSVVLHATGHDGLALLALAVCLFQLIAHGFAKAALFLAAGAFGGEVGDLRLDRLGGLARRMPQTSTAFTVAALSLAAIPPLAGFAAEWALLQSALGAASVFTGPPALAMVALAAAIGLVTGLAALAFCKLLGQSLTGLPRHKACESAREPGVAARFGMLGAASGAILLGLGAGWVLPWLAASVGDSLSGRFGSVVTPVDSGIVLELPGSGGLPGLGLAGALLAFGWLAFRLRSRERAEPAPTWICGQPASARLAWSGAGFVKTLRLSTTTRPGLERQVVESGSGIEIVHTGEAPHPFAWRLHRPAFTLIAQSAARARMMQSGRLRAYLLYLAVTLLVALFVARIGLL